jgi:hypothetical protein
VHHQNIDDSGDIATVGDRVWLSWSKSHSYLIQDRPTDTDSRSAS